MREVFRMLYENHLFHGIRFHESKWEGDLLTIVGSESTRIDPGLAAASIRILGERLEKTPEDWVRKWKSVMPKQAQDKILTGYPALKLLRIKWSEIEKESAASAGLNIQEVLKQEKETQRQPEQGSLSFEEEAEEFYRQAHQEHQKREEMSAFEEPQQQQEQGSLSFEDEAEQFYRRQEEKEWRRQEM